MQTITRAYIAGARQQRRRTVRSASRRSFATGAPDPATLKNNLNVLNIGVQTIFAGTEALDPFVAELKTYSRRPLIVTDEGIAKVGIVQQFVDALKKAGLQPTVFGAPQVPFCCPHNGSAFRRPCSFGLSSLYPFVGP